MLFETKKLMPCWAKNYKKRKIEIRTFGNKFRLKFFKFSALQNEN